MSVHRIRLHGPWQVRPHDVRVSPDRTTIPGSLRDAGFTDYVGPVPLHRSFGRPTNLEAQEQVWLAFDEVRGLESIIVNGVQLHMQGESLEFEVTGMLKERNELVVVVRAEDGQSGIVGNVLLEIRS